MILTCAKAEASCLLTEACEGSYDTLLAIQLYYKIHREVTSIAQTTVVHERSMYLYEHKVKTQYREFPIDEVFDMSYRKMGSSEGFLYLHTKQGVYSYTVRADPHEFIAVFKELK